jgi:hypothetical protein
MLKFNELILLSSHSICKTVKTRSVIYYWTKISNQRRKVICILFFLDILQRESFHNLQSSIILTFLSHRIQRTWDDSQSWINCCESQKRAWKASNHCEACQYSSHFEEIIVRRWHMTDEERIKWEHVSNKISFAIIVTLKKCNCATALYYYNFESIFENLLAFR